MSYNILYSISDEDFINIIQNNKYIKDIGLLIGYKGVNDKIKSAILKRAKELGVSTEHIANKFSPKYDSKFSSITDEEFINIYMSNQYMVDILKELGYAKTSGTMTRYVKERAEKLKLSSNHILGKNGNRGSNNGYNIYSMSEILVENSTYYNRTSLKRRLVKEGILEYKCEKCGNKGMWQGKLLSLELDHINGVNNDNRLSNLRFLCPNCHSQTKTFSGRNCKNEYKSKCGGRVRCTFRPLKV